MAEETSVLIADDHAFSSSGLQQLLEGQPGFRVLDPVRDGLEAVALARSERPGLAVLDYAMPNLTGLDVMREIRRWSPQTRVVILTGSTSAALLSSIVQAGANGLFLKSCDPQDIVTGLHRVLSGETVVPDDVHSKISLSQRELEILGCIAEGLTNGGTAERLSISIKTVESHRMSLMRKLDVRSTASLLVRAIQEGLIEP